MAKKTESSSSALPGISEIEQFIEQAGSDDLPAFGGKFEGGVHIQQIPDELAGCIAALLNSGATIKSYLEIGSAAGGTAYVLNNYFSFENIVLIDLNTHPKAKYRPEVLKGIERREIIGSSSDEGVLSAVEELNTRFDLILIDGDHQYSAIKADMENYLPYLNEGGYLILHDSDVKALGICVVAAELKGRSDMELVGEYSTKKHTSQCGIALFRKVAE